MMGKSRCPALNLNEKTKTSPASFVDLVAGLRGEPFGKHTHTNPSG